MGLVVLHKVHPRCTMERNSVEHVLHEAAAHARALCRGIDGDRVNSTYLQARVQEIAADDALIPRGNHSITPGTYEAHRK